MKNLAMAIASVGLALAACGPTSRGSDNPDDGTGIDALPGSGDANPDCLNSCSADLHSIVDCNGTVLETCSADQGCGANGCTDPCQAAADNQSSIGCDYYAIAPEIIVEAAGACFAAFVANTWGTPVAITVDRAGIDYPIASFARIPSGSGLGLTYAPLTDGLLQPGQVAILFLSRFGNAIADCPGGVTPALTTQDAAVQGTGYGAAFHITTSAPTVAYDIYPYGGGASAATSATLLLPTSAWDVNYVGVDAFRKSVVVASAQPSMAVVAMSDGTAVTVNGTAAIVGGPGVDPAPSGVPVTYIVNAGQILQFTQDAELIGSAIQSDKPIGLWAGASCLSVDVDEVACDSAHQQIPPVNALGHRYAAVRYRNRFADQQEEVVPWRIVGAAEGTALTYSPSAPPGAPTTLTVGQVAEFSTASPFVVASQDGEHPFYMSGYMTGCQHVNPNFDDCRGDPEFVNVIPLDQYLAKYTFFTDPTYPETNLVLTRQKRDGVFADVSLDCAGTITGWQPVDASGDVEYARIDLVTGNFQSVNGCDNGLHVAESTQPFGIVVWGWGSAASGGFQTQAVSYAYPAGASIKPINTVVVPID